MLNWAVGSAAIIVTKLASHPFRLSLFVECRENFFLSPIYHIVRIPMVDAHFTGERIFGLYCCMGPRLVSAQFSVFNIWHSMNFVFLYSERYMNFCRYSCADIYIFSCWNIPLNLINCCDFYIETVIYVHIVLKPMALLFKFTVSTLLRLFFR